MCVSPRRVVGMYFFRPTPTTLFCGRRRLAVFGAERMMAGMHTVGCAKIGRFGVWHDLVDRTMNRFIDLFSGD